MVDLVKIRKKAKEKAGEAVKPELGGAPVSPPAPEATDVEPKEKQAVSRTPTAAREKKPKRAGESLARAQLGNTGAPQTSAAPAAAKPASTDNRQRTTDNRESATAPGAGSKLARFLEHAGERRTERAQENRGESAEQIEVLTFSIAGELYALPIDNVVEIVTPRNVTAIPNSDPSVVGILSLRGMIVTLIDVRRRLGHRPLQEHGPDTRVIVMQFGQETLGFTVDKVLRVIKIDLDAVAPHPVVHASEQDESVRGVFRHADALTILLDLDKLLGTSPAAATATSSR